ncbi:YaeC family lipoprotein [Bradyrhizobium sp. USDA 377]
MRRRLFLVMAAFALFTAPASADQKIKVGISGGDAEIVWTKVKEIAAKDGLDVQVVVFNDYLLPNAALDVGDLDANAFQHKPFLDNQIKTRGYKIVAVGETIVASIGLYSRKAKSVAEIKEGASIGTIRRTAAVRCGCFRRKS